MQLLVNTEIIVELEVISSCKCIWDFTFSIFCFNNSFFTPQVLLYHFNVSQFYNVIVFCRSN